ncbi:MAG: low molecular weight protein-tyrosine-phosphatase [Planctomycetota bacterium]
MASTDQTAVLMICMGNICRSPLAEGIFRYLVNERRVADRFLIDSCGTGGWHAGELADHRMRETARGHGIGLDSRARQVRREDFTTFDHLICMDEDNRANILAMGAPTDRVSLLLDFDRSHDVVEVPDPYYGGDDGFEHVYQLVYPACEALLDALLGQSS